MPRSRRFLDEVRTHFPGDEARVVRMSLIEETPVKQVRMAHLAIVGTHSTNGVAAIHSELLGRTAVRDFADMFPERFNNKTNGVTPRRWLLLANPDLSRLIMEAIGDSRIKDLAQLRNLIPLADDAAFVAYWEDIGERYGLNLEVVNRTIDPTFRFMTEDWDGQIRMDPSSPYAMARQVGLKARFDVACASDTDADRHGIISHSQRSGRGRNSRPLTVRWRMWSQAWWWGWAPAARRSSPPGALGSSCARAGCAISSVFRVRVRSRPRPEPWASPLSWIHQTW